MRFKRIYIEISNRCNLDCSFCPPVKRAGRTMSVAEFERILHEIKPYTSYVYLHIKGEPLLHPHLQELLTLCGQVGLQVNITTNGTLLSQTKELLLSASSVRQVNISIHSFKEQQGIDQQYYLQQVISFGKEAFTRQKPYVVFRMWNLSHGREVDPASLQILAQIKDSFNIGVDLVAEMAKSHSVCLADGVFISWEKEFVWPSLENPFVSHSGFCHGARDMLGILCDGTVVPCCLDANGEAPLGNIFEEDFAGIVQGKKLMRLTNGFIGGKAFEPLCQHCTFRTRFDKGK